jgi:hypothetical protein
MAPVESIYTKDIVSISFNDVMNFFNLKIRESLRIDYKRDFPAELERIVASFANTAGGIILIGIATDEANKPNEMPGIDFVKGLEERVLNICHSNSSPPITPEVVVCPFQPASNEGKCIVVVRIQESGQAPHFVGKKRNQIYVRHDNESELADADEIRNLMHKREEGLRRTKELFESRKLVISDPTTLPGIPPMRYTQVAVAPASATTDIIKFTSEADDFLKVHPFGLKFGDERIKQRGIQFEGRIRREAEARTETYFSEVTAEGAVFYKEGVSDGKNEMYYPRIIFVIAKVLEYSVGVYRKFGYSGGLVVRVELANVLGCSLGPMTDPRLTGSSAAPYVLIERYVTVDSVDNDHNLTADIFLELTRAFGWSLTRDEAQGLVDHCLSK